MVSQEDSSCPNGGKVFTFFNDINDNGELDSSENILGSESVCNGEDGVDGIDGNAGSGYALFIEQATTSECTNGGFKISVFIDLNSNAEYDSSTESIKNSTVICYPDKDSIEFPDYSELGHRLDALGFWRLYSINGIIIPEKDRFNLHIYPDPLNPNLLVNEKAGQTGWVDFPNNNKISWTYYNNGEVAWDQLYFDIDNIVGVSKEPDAPQSRYFRLEGIRYFNNSNPLRIEVLVQDRDLDLEVWPYGLMNAVFYKVQ